MKKEIMAVALSVALLVGAGSVYGGNNKDKDKDKSKRKSHVTDVRAVPEIDATSGTPAIALVLGVALLGAERLRRRSKPNS